MIFALFSAIMLSMTTSQSIGIFGGTFDPVHNGHLKLANYLLLQLKLQQLRLIPCYQSPHRQPAQASASQRLTMLKLATADTPDLIVDDREIKRRGQSYTISTLLELQQEFRNNTLILIIGADAFINFTKWHKWQTILELCNIVVVNRPGCKVDLKKILPEKQVKEFNNFSGKILLLNTPPVDISATTIRELAKQHKDLIDLVPHAVEEFIIEQQLYL